MMKTPGRRIAGRERGPRRLAGPAWTVAGAVAVVAVAAGLLVVAGLTPPDPVPAPAPATTTAVPVTRTDAVCPTPLTGDRSVKELRGFRSGVSAVAADGSELGVPGTNRTAGDVFVRRTDGSGPEPDLGLAERGVWASASLDGAPSDLIATAQGTLAPAFAAFAGAVAPPDAGGGLEVIGCIAPQREWWFVGAGATPEHTTSLVLTNVEETQAVVTVTVHGGDGIRDTVGTDGIVVGSGQTVVLAMTSIASGADDLAVSVRTTQGRVSAAMQESWQTVSQPAGTEWLPAAALPDTDVTIAGVSGRNRTLLVANDADRTATVEATVVDGEGTFASDDLPQFDVPPGGVTRIDLPASLGKDELGLRLASDEAVTASVRVESPGSPTDVAYGAALDPVTVGTVVPLDLSALPPSADVSLILASPAQTGGAGAPSSRATAATVVAYDAAGQELDRIRVSVPPDRLVAADPKIADGAAYLVVTPLSGTPTVTTSFETRAGGLSVLPGYDLAVATAAPAVAPAPR